MASSNDEKPNPDTLQNADIDRSTVHTWDDVQNLLPPLTGAEKAALRRSIDSSGVLNPVLVLPDGRIVDGHHRWELSGGTAPVRTLQLSEEEARDLAFSLNLARRQLAPEQLSEVHAQLRRDRTQRRRVALGLRKEGKTQAETAALVGVDRTTVAKWESGTLHKQGESSQSVVLDLRTRVPRKLFRTIHARVRAGETQTDIAAEYKVSQQRVSQILKVVDAWDREPQPARDPGPLPLGRLFKAIVIDPPWPVEKAELYEARPNAGDNLDYRTMSLDEIAALPIQDLVDPDGGHVYLWVTHKMLPAGLKLFEQWGIRFQSLLTWVKPQGVTAYQWCYNTEHVLFGVVGPLRLQKLGVMLTFEGKAKIHSEKPDSFYDLVRAVSLEPRLELFARKEREGFEVWGDEVPRERE